MESAALSNPDLRSLPRKVFDVLSGFGLATILLLLLGLLTWFATLEQIDHGLYATLHKYFHWKSPFLFPEITVGGGDQAKSMLIPLPLPGGYWVCALLFVNLSLGAILRARKGMRHLGNLIAHFGILFMLVSGAVAHHFSERGHMAVSEGETSDVAEAYYEYVVEVAEIKDADPAVIHVIRGPMIDDLTDGESRLFRFPALPFDLEIAGYQANAVPVGITERAPSGERVVDGYYLMGKPSENEAEANTAGCYARVVRRDGSKSDPFILAGASFHPFTLEESGRLFTVDMHKRFWAMPFSLQLDHFTAKFHPGTMKPSDFISNITRLENGAESKVTIAMNEPMRYEGLTFFQSSYGPQGAGPGTRMYSVFEVVRNPADKWPEYSLYVVAFGLSLSFAIKLLHFILASNRKKSHG